MNMIVGQIVEVLSESKQNKASSSISQIATKVLEFLQKQFKENSEAQHKLNRLLKEPESQKQAFSEFLVKAVQDAPLLETVLSQLLSELEWSERERIHELVKAKNLKDTEPNLPEVQVLNSTDYVDVRRVAGVAGANFPRGNAGRRCTFGGFLCPNCQPSKRGRRICTLAD